MKSFVSRLNSCENCGELSLLPVSMLMALGLNWKYWFRARSF